MPINISPSPLSHPPKKQPCLVKWPIIISPAVPSPSLPSNFTRFREVWISCRRVKGVVLNIHRDVRGWRKKATEVSVTVLSPSLPLRGSSRRGERDITEPWCPLNKDVERKESGGSPSFSFFRPWKEMRKGNDTLALGSGTSSVSFLTSYGFACTF